MLKASHIPQYKDLALLLTRYGRKDFVLNLGTTDLTAESPADKPLEADVKARALAFVAALKALGPTYVKFGQILSTRGDIVPREYIEALEELQDSVEPFPYDEVEAIVETELGFRISKGFAEFEKEPIAAASLSQVHRAVMRDGREVAVKVQRPNIRETMVTDLQVFGEIAEFLEAHTTVGKKLDLVRAVEQGGRMLLAELNFRLEARNVDTFKKNLAEFEELHIPTVVHAYTTDRVLTAEFIRGSKVSRITPLMMTEQDYSRFAPVLMRAYLKQICVDGLWHSDPHPGNLFVSGDKLVLLDFGMVSRMSREMQDSIVKLLLAMTENRGREAAEVCLELGTTGEKFVRETFVRDVSDVITHFWDADYRQVNTGQLMFQLITIANNNDVRLPGEMAILAKTLLHLDSVARTLDPNFDPPSAIRDYAEQLIGYKVAQKFHPRNLYAPLLEMNELLIELPRRSREILHQAATGRSTLNIKLSQADDLLNGIHKVANRITAGIVVAALLISASLMMRVPSSVMLFGYPAISVVGYIIAVLVALATIASSLVNDHRDRVKTRRKIEMGQ
jgi:predicted unusual protein kinase regulating ubiquinone biosynthesis (AarF/ABC1/UbiB family)